MDRTAHSSSTRRKRQWLLQLLLFGCCFFYHVSSAPSKRPTPSPTTKPTKKVTSKPTKLVTPSPTKTPFPTKQVTPKPTVLITPKPTVFLTPKPTLGKPSKVPTPQPTVDYKLKKTICDIYWCKGGPPTDPAGQHIWDDKGCEDLYINDLPPQAYINPKDVSKSIDWSVGSRMRDRFVGRCMDAAINHDYPAVDCAEMWVDLETIIRYHEPSELDMIDYYPFFNKWGPRGIPTKPDQTVLWDSGRAHSMYKIFVETMNLMGEQDTPIGHAKDVMPVLCGSTTTTSGFSSSTVECGNQMWDFIRYYTARFTQGNFYWLLDTGHNIPVASPDLITRQEEIYMMTSSVSKVTMLPLIRDKNGEGCGAGSLKQTAIQLRNHFGSSLQIDCIDNANNLRHIQCALADKVPNWYAPASSSDSPDNANFYSGTYFDPLSGASSMCYFNQPGGRGLVKM